MKVIIRDNFARGRRTATSSMPVPKEAERIADEENKKRDATHPDFFAVVADDYELHTWEP